MSSQNVSAVTPTARFCRDSTCDGYRVGVGRTVLNRSVHFKALDQPRGALHPGPPLGTIEGFVTSKKLHIRVPTLLYTSVQPVLLGVKRRELVEFAGNIHSF
eukprot:1177635-Prorocentrum_minimum.AAC.3